MKKGLISFVAVIFGLIFCYGQTNKHVQSPIPFTTKNLVGMWQENDKREGSGFLQNFQFFKNGLFKFNLCNPNEDIRDIIAIKGKYRLVGDSLLLTILSKIVIVGGQISVGGGGSETEILSIEGGTPKEIYIQNPKELNDPLYIHVINSKCIRIGDEIYYKISSDPNYQPK